MSNFNIYITSNLEQNKHYQKPTFTQGEDSKLDYAILDFTEMYKFSEWMIVFDTEEVKFTLKELRLIWKDIPRILNELCASDTANTRLEFFDQGYEGAINMESLPNKFVKVSNVNYRNPQSSQNIHVTVSKLNCINVWENFIKEVISLLVGKNYIEREDTNVQNYFSQIPKIEI